MKDQWTQMEEPASTMSGQVDHLFWFLVILCSFTAILIIGLLIFFTIKYRRREGQVHTESIGNRMRVILEIVWIGLPLITFLGIFVWGARVYFRQVQVPAHSLQMYVVAQQWMWKFQHPEGRREINELHVPLGKPVSVTLISQDVIHSFFVPAFRIKMDVVPGRYTQIWFNAQKEGNYRLFCSQYCGTWHSRMIGTIIVMKPKDYEKWAVEKSQEQMALRGKELFKRFACIQCHREGGRVSSPLLNGLFGSAVHLSNGQVVRADEAYIRDSIFDPGRQIVEGYSNVMPTFKHQLTEENVLELIEYIKSLSNQGEQ